MIRIFVKTTNEIQNGMIIFIKFILVIAPCKLKET